MPYVLACDQGTTSTRAIVFDETGAKRGVAQIPLPQIFPQPGWVEHDAEVIWSHQHTCCQDAIAAAGITAADLSAVAVTNQRETSIVWDRATGEPIANAIVWQDRRTAETCDEIASRPGVSAMVRQRTGLGIDPYFSASKIAWLLDNTPGARARAEAGELAFGTVDCWLTYRLSGGKVHVTDHSNASRTLLLDIESGCWDPELCALFDVPMSLLPEVVPSSGVVGHTDAAVLGAAIPIAGICGDQQAALAGNGGFAPGDAKATFGTGVFALMHTGSTRPYSQKLAVTLAATTGPQMQYALEGTVFMGGAIVQWLVEELKLAETPAALQALAETVPDSNGVVLVPALTGLGAPEWDPYARGAVFGLTRGANSAHLARAALESIGLQVGDLVGAMTADSGHALHRLRCDGGVTVNALVMQSLANILSVPVDVAAMAESTALGAAYLAGLATGVWDGPDDLPMLTAVGHTYEVDADGAARMTALKAKWGEAVRRSLQWEHA